MKRHEAYQSWVRAGAIIALAGFILSGPVSFLVVMLTHPQPEWVSADVFVQHYHPLQTLPYLLGFPLVGGVIVVVVAHASSVPFDKVFLRLRLSLSLALTLVFAALVVFNYICQTTFVHNLAMHYVSENASLISAFSMANPLSFCWANEFWGYAILGVATWLLAGYYRGISKATQMLLVINGPVSIVAAIWTIIDVQWVLTTAGLVSYLLWNVLMIATMILIYWHHRNPAHPKIVAS